MSASVILQNLLLLVYYWVEGLVLWFVPRSFRSKSVKGHVVVVTGGGSGIGRLLCQRFAALGARVAVWDLDGKTAEATAALVREKGGEAKAFACDVSQPQSVYDAAARTKAEVGKVDILVNNAGIVTGKRLLDCPDHMIKKTFEVNALAHFWTCKAFLPDMMAENKGHLVSIASLAGMYGLVRLTDYCASKFAAIGFEESLRLELLADGYDGIRSTVICPFFINTGMFEGINSGMFPVLTPEYVADEIVASVLINKEVVLLPKIFYFMAVLKGFIPAKFAPKVFESFDLTGAMDKFKGRQKKTE